MPSCHARPGEAARDLETISEVFAVKLGVVMFVTDETIRPDLLGRATESYGFESLFVPEHTHIPVDRQSPYPGGGELPREYCRTLDPFVSLTAAAVATSELRLGFGICLLVERDPIVTAKAVASLDLLSAGRVLFGVGAGWNREEMRNHGTDPATRFAVVSERVKAVKALWQEAEASFHGDHVHFDAVWSWPKPHQSPHPPILLGGGGPSVISRVLDHADGWMPVGYRGSETLPSRIAELRSRAAEQGKRSPSVTIFGASPDPATLASYADLGVERCLFTLPSLPTEQALDVLAARASLIREFG